nr:tetraspanin-19 [Ipomoea batatas]GMC72817.1 tetraspanin-19 [Ipomoea batatas]GMC76914.1 tetraspanin-19 [Ipomoea batatas]
MDIVRSCIQRMLKMVNSLIGLSGLLMILYGCWMFTTLQPHVPCSDVAPSFWFIYTTIGVGFSVNLIACTGHIAAETCNTCYLYSYVFFIYIFHLLETYLLANVFLNINWEEDLPKDTTGNIDKIKDFIEDNYEICKWIGLLAVTVPAVCASLALILKALEPGYLEGRQDYALDVAPLLENYVAQPSHVIDIDPASGSKQA